MLWPCRCRGCQGRRTLKRHPDSYKVTPPCKSCGVSESKLRKMYERAGGIPARLMGKCLTWRVDYYRKENPLKDRNPSGTCYSQDCFHYPHRHGSKGCKHREDFLLERALKGSKTGKSNNSEPGF